MPHDPLRAPPADRFPVSDEASTADPRLISPTGESSIPTACWSDSAEVVRWNFQRAVGPEENAFIAPFFSVVETSVPPEEEINPCTLAVC
jgi:hypothetical protein